MKPNRQKLFNGFCLCFAILVLLATQSCKYSTRNNLVLSCKEDNDLYLTLLEAHVDCSRFSTPEKAINKADEGAGVLLLADGYPGKTTAMDASLYEKAAGKKLRLYVEYPAFLPGIETGEPRGTHWERAVISSDAFNPGLQKLRIVAIHDCRFIPVKASHPDIVVGRVAGFDFALFGLPEKTYPILFNTPGLNGSGEIMVSTTKLSQFISARYAPEEAWRTIWRHVFAWLRPNDPVPDLKWTPSVRPSFGSAEQLPEDVEKQALKRGIAWYFNSRMVMSQSMMNKYNRPANGPEPASANPDTAQDWPYGHRIALKPDEEFPAGDGTLGVMEGFDAKIFSDGTQPVRWWRRNDCNGEIAGAMSLAGLALENPDYMKVGNNIGNWLYLSSPMSLGDHANPDHPAYGLVGWNDIPEYCGPNTMDGFGVYYDDDNARTALGVILSAAVNKTDRYDERLSRNLMALMRITNKRGFLPDRIDQPVLLKRGWKSYSDDPGQNLSPGMHAYVWSYYLWAYNQTGYDLFVKRAVNAINETMQTFPVNDIWNMSNRARMLLPLAWLVRIDDTPQHRKWLRDMAESLNQMPNGAIRDELRKGAWAAPPKSNEEYGTAEASLLQTGDDVVGDILYTMNFAFVGLHEAALATGDNYFKEAEDKLARFLCRIQIRSEKQPDLDGGWFRAFDIKNWEYWASSTDAGWGAWCIESGWSQSWITIVLALRQLDTSIWDITRDSSIEEKFDAARKEMLPDNMLKTNP